MSKVTQILESSTLIETMSQHNIFEKNVIDGTEISMKYWMAGIPVI